MMKNRLIFLGIIVFFAVALSGCGQKTDYPVVDGDAKLIFFFGETCPHCEIVEDYFKENKVEEKIDFEKAEVYTVKANAEVMKEKAQICGIGLDELGVPMLWNNGECIIGDKDIISFFEERLKNDN